jgi:hypothetical protein
MFKEPCVLVMIEICGLFILHGEEVVQHPKHLSDAYDKTSWAALEGL